MLLFWNVPESSSSTPATEVNRAETDSGGIWTKYNSNITHTIITYHHCVVDCMYVLLFPVEELINTELLGINENCEPSMKKVHPRFQQLVVIKQ